MSKTILFVSAFRDIGRGNWNGWIQRSVDVYISSFKKLAYNINYRLIVFVEPEVKEKLMKMNLPPNIEILDLRNYQTMYEKFIDREREIMMSNNYKSMVPDRRKFLPEHWSAEYTLLNHIKVNYVAHAKRLYPTYDFYSWLDFGLIENDLRSVPRKINLDKLSDNKACYMLLNNVPSCRISPIEMLKTDNIYITGSHFILPSGIVESFEKIYENKIQDFQNMGICDDDQNLLFQIYFDNPDIFQFFVSSEWKSLFKNFLNTV